MKKEEFLSYCNRIQNLIADVSGWSKCPPSLIGDYLRENTGYGFAQVLYDLAGAAYDLLKEEEGKPNAQYDLYELASLLSVRRVLPDYRFGAYVFAVCVVAVCTGKKSCDEVDYEQFDENDLKSYDFTVSAEEENDPQAKKLNKYCLRLLDFSRNNQLVNFRFVKTGTIPLVSASVAKTMALVAAKKKISLASWQKLNASVILKCRSCGRMTTAKYDSWAKKSQSAVACPVCDAGNVHNRKSMTPVKEYLTFLDGDRYACKCGKTLSVAELYKNNFVCPDCGATANISSFPLIERSALTAYNDAEAVCAISDNESREVAKKLYNKAKAMDRNFGLHVLYLACGFLRWRDGNNTEYNSPLLLCPINLYPDRSVGSYYFEGTGATNSGFEVNKTLIHMLSGYSKMCSIRLPELDESNLGAYFAQVKHALRSNPSLTALTKDWEVVPEMGIGLFHYQKLQLENDIRENRDKYLAHPVIRRLCGDEGCQIVAAKVLSDKLYHMALDADSSQESVIRAAQQGKSFILQGPPGSGKSQTITNIISVAVGEGKSVLFVTEKASARSVILDNLSRLTVDGTRKLNSFVLDFDSFNKRGGAIAREPFVKELNDCLSPYVPPFGYDDQLLADEAFGRMRVEKFMSQYKEEYGGKSLQGLLQGVAEYAQFKLLDCINRIPYDRVKLNELSDLLGRYYVLTNKFAAAFDYRSDELYGCFGDLTSNLYSYACAYVKVADRIEGVLLKLASVGWTINKSEYNFKRTAEILKQWVKLPAFTREILQGLNADKVRSLRQKAENRRACMEIVQTHTGLQIRDGLVLSEYSESKLNKFVSLELKYNVFFKRIGNGYKNFLTSVAACFKYFNEKLTYNAARAAIADLQTYQYYLDIKKDYEAGENEDKQVFGFVPSSLAEWDKLIDELKTAEKVVTEENFAFIGSFRDGWLQGFDYDGHAQRVALIASLAKEAEEALGDESYYGNRLKAYFDGATAANSSLSSGYPRFKSLAVLAVKNSARLDDWCRVNDVLNALSKQGWTDILDELIKKNITDFTNAKGAVYRTFCEKEIKDFINKYGLDAVKDFNRASHEKLIRDYADVDTRTLKRGAVRLYETLSRNLLTEGRAHARSQSSDLPKIQNKTGYSIKKTISENWDYIRRIKPCFMMSPLNVSQYVDIDTQFDLVIFDEASQIFTEDALASIVRAKQVIIAGDSKQLPPCDFFRAGDASQDDEEQYYEEEGNSGNSLLDAAGSVLQDGENSQSLSWHYRSCDEALIDFSNRHMDYDLVTFPSAYKNANDGICYVPVPYSPATCYEAGKSGAHVNKGEAEKIIEIIWEEMNHPERCDFSIGVVAFSNAQAVEIE